MSSLLLHRAEQIAWVSDLLPDTLQATGRHNLTAAMRLNLTTKEHKHGKS